MESRYRVAGMFLRCGDEFCHALCHANAVPRGLPRGKRRLLMGADGLGRQTEYWIY